jgi:hypothetical protein
MTTCRAIAVLDGAGVRADLIHVPAGLHLTDAPDHEVIADGRERVVLRLPPAKQALEAARPVPLVDLGHADVAAVRRGRAMDDEQVDLAHRSIVMALPHRQKGPHPTHSVSLGAKDMC